MKAEKIELHIFADGEGLGKKTAVQFGRMKKSLCKFCLQDDFLQRLFSEATPLCRRLVVKM